MNNLLTDYFNIMALNIMFIEERLANHQLCIEDMSVVFDDKNNQQHLNMINKVPEIIDDNGGSIELLSKQITKAFIERVSNFLDEFSDDLHQLIILLHYLDFSICNVYDGFTNDGPDYTRISSINTNVDETSVTLMRKVVCKWDRKGAGKIDCGVNNNLLENFYYYNTGKVDGAVVNHILMDNIYLFPEGNKNLRIGISPLLSAKTIRISDPPYKKTDEVTHNNLNFFNINSIDNLEAIESNIKTIINLAGEKKLDFLVFPEMIGSEDVLQSICGYLENSFIAKPKILVFPSIWTRTENDACNTNISIVLDEFGEVIFKQHKRKRFWLQYGADMVFEDINTNVGNSIQVLHIPNIGRVCIVICYDFLDLQNREMIAKNIQPTLVISPSFSTGSHSFAVLRESLFAYSCNWVWCNTCSAINVSGSKKMNFDTIGIITKLSKNNLGLNFADSFEGVGKCEKNNCSECLFITELELNNKNRGE